MAKKTRALILIVAALLLIAAFAVCYFTLIKPPLPEKVFESSLSCVFEVKAVSDDKGESFGTGVLIDKYGTVITNAHITTYSSLNIKHEFDKFYIRYATEKEYREAALIKYNEEIDIAVLKIKDIAGLNLKPIKIGKTEKLKSGETVFAVGNAVNHGISISKGIVSIPLIEIAYDDLTRKVIQCDLNINEGSSGGALFDERGRLIGITTFRIKDKQGNIVYGLAYCIPINVAMDYVNN
jgi:S1-C subfamily serine protease